MKREPAVRVLRLPGFGASDSLALGINQDQTQALDLLARHKESPQGHASRREKENHLRRPGGAATSRRIPALAQPTCLAMSVRPGESTGAYAAKHGSNGLAPPSCAAMRKEALWSN